MFQSLGIQVFPNIRDPGNVSAWSGKTINKLARDRIGHGGEHNRYCRGGSFGGNGCRARYCDQYVDLEPDQFSREVVKSLILFSSKTIFERDVLPLDVAEILETLLYRYEEVALLLRASCVP